MHLPRTIALPSGAGDRLLVGRCDACDVRLDSLKHSTMMSRRHCLLVRPSPSPPPPPRDDDDAAATGVGEEEEEAAAADSGATPMWYLEDLGSSNGTSLNNVRLQGGTRVPIQEGDVVLFGSRGVSEARYTCEVRVEGEAECET